MRSNNLGRMALITATTGFMVGGLDASGHYGPRSAGVAAGAGRPSVEKTLKSCLHV